MALAAPHREQVMTASGLDVLAGIWLLISPFILKFGMTHATTNNIVLGIAIAALSAVRFSGAYQQSWLSWINVVLGAWVLVTPWVLSFSHNHMAMANNVILGILIILLAGWSALATDISGRTYGGGDYHPPT